MGSAFRNGDFTAGDGEIVAWPWEILGVLKLGVIEACWAGVCVKELKSSEQPQMVDFA